MVGAPGGRTSSSPAINTTPTILRKKIEEPRIVGALRVFPRSVMVRLPGARVERDHPIRLRRR